jgi:hypothetical protein
MAEILTQPVELWVFFLMLGYVAFFRWRKNDNSRKLIAKRIDGIEGRLERIEQTQRNS